MLDMDNGYFQLFFFLFQLGFGHFLLIYQIKVKQINVDNISICCAKWLRTHTRDIPLNEPTLTLTPSS